MNQYAIYENGKPTHRVNAENFNEILTKLDEKYKSRDFWTKNLIIRIYRIELKTLGYSKEEMKELTPKKANEIIKKGIPKTPSRDRNRNQ